MTHSARPDDVLFEVLRDDLARRVGIGNAITIDVLAHLHNASRRRIEVILECRLADFGFPLVSCDCGYYRPATPEDLNHYLASLLSRIRCIALRIRTVRRSALEEGWTREGGRFVRKARQGELFA